MRRVRGPGLGGDQTKLIVQCATGAGPAIVDVYSQEQMINLVNAGVLLDLTPYAEDMGCRPGHTYPALQDALLVDGKQYRYPCNVWANCLIYNEEIFDDHGVPYPKGDWTWEDFIETARQLRESKPRSGETHITFANWNGGGLFSEMLAGLQGRMFTEDGLHCALDSPEGIRAAQAYYDLIHTHHAIPSPREMANMPSQGGWGSGGLTLFSMGKAAMLIIGRWYLIQVPNYPDVRGKLGAVRMPRFEGYPQTGLADTRAAAINAQSPHWREALNFLKYLASEEYGQLIVHDGDSLPPNPKLATCGEARVNEIAPDPAFHQPFVDAIEDARPWDTSPFIDPTLAHRWMFETMDKIENGLVDPPEAMHALAREMDHQIVVNLERQPHLRAKFRERTGREWTPDWWRTGPDEKRP